ncbi:Checkpoint protein hus1 [Hypoxylon texense]
MSPTLSVVKTLIVPAVISLILFLVSTYVLVPLWRFYHARYSHYLPLDTISNHTTSLRVRIQDAIARWLIPSRWRFGGGDRVVVGADDASDLGFSSEEGEELDEVDDDRRHALSLDARHVDGTDSMRRLSRDLEEGFRDDSDEEDSNAHRSTQ